MSVSEIVDYYVQDNERAEREGVAIPPRPNPHRKRWKQQQQHQQRRKQHKRNRSLAKDALFSASSSSLSALATAAADANAASSSSSSLLRCLQWNIQAFLSPKDERNMHTITAGIIRSICETDSDVLVLNEIHWRETETLDFTYCERTHQQIQTSQALLEEFLRLRGYSSIRVAGHGDTPTLIASRKRVLRSKEIVLSHNRSALCLLIESQPSGLCWVVGTHLDAFDAEGRRSEIVNLLQTATTSTSNDHIPVLIMGDFNQQRSRDYTPAEWNRISASADLRGAPSDDGVASILETSGFRCVFDDVRQHPEEDDANAAAAAVASVSCNWDQTQPPPSTHWSGTTIDYTYYSNQQQLPSESPSDSMNTTTTTTTATATTITKNQSTTSIDPHGVYVGPAGFSDHRMTVTDWTLTTTTPDTIDDEASGPLPRHIDKSFFFNHLPAGRHHSWLYCKGDHLSLEQF